MENDKPTCGTCPYWQFLYQKTAHDEDGGIVNCGSDGECRIRSVPNEHWSRDYFPTRADDEWCGEHPEFKVYLARKEQNDLVEWFEKRRRIHV